MVRAMQLLLPGSRLRPEFVHAALVEAKRRWLGSIEEFERVVATRRDVIGDHVFYDPPLHGDATTRWEGALHVRGMPNALEGGHDGGPFRAEELGDGWRVAASTDCTAILARCDGLTIDAPENACAWRSRAGDVFAVGDDLRNWASDRPHDDVLTVFTSQKLEAAGLRDAYAFGGGLHCCTADVYREGDLKDYFPKQ